MGTQARKRAGIQARKQAMRARTHTAARRPVDTDTPMRSRTHAQTQRHTGAGRRRRGHTEMQHAAIANAATL
eukprot:13079762-Alexandrium_andersonii.AAC.1